MKCHYIWDEEVGKVLIPACAGVAFNYSARNPMWFCTCRTYTTHAGFERQEYNKKIKEQNELIKSLEKENAALNRIIKMLIKQTKMIKQTLLLLLFPLLTSAQISVYLISPSGSVGSTTNLLFDMVNNGPDSIKTTDTIIFTVPGFAPTGYVGYGCAAKDTLHFNYPNMPVSDDRYCVKVQVNGYADSACNDLTTSIELIQRSSNIPVRVYNMQGVLQTGTLTPGVYIINRRKIVVR